MRLEDQNVSLHDMDNLYYNTWKSRQFVKRQEDSYKEYVKSSLIVQLIDEALKSLANNKTYLKAKEV